jgi:hypothetical protein
MAMSKEVHRYIIAIYGPMIYMAPYVMVLMRADPLRGQVGGGWALEIETFWAVGNDIKPLGRVPFGGQTKFLGQCSKFFFLHSPPPLPIPPTSLYPITIFL